MDTRKIGSLDVSVIGLGCNNFGLRIDDEATRAVVAAAVDSGINLFDTADMYSSGTSEEFLGRALGRRRNDVLIASKFGKPVGGAKASATPEYIRGSIDGSLKRLGTDRIDLYQLHEPHPETPIADTLGELTRLVDEGKVREIGCSNFSAAQLREAREAREGGSRLARFASVQNEYSLLVREAEQGVLEECEREGIAFIPYYPLASGLLTGKYHKGEAPPAGTRIASGWGRQLYTPENLEKVERLSAFASERGHTLLELAMSWLLARPVVASVIAGATSPAQVRANAVAGDWRISAADLGAIDGLLAD